MTTTAEPSTAQIPRPVTPRARRRAWAETNVRLWWLSALAVGFVALWLVSAEIIDGLNKRAKLRSGIPVIATIDTVAGKAVRTRGTPMNVRLRYSVNGVDIVDTQEKTIEATSGADVIRGGDTLPIRVDPNDLTQWIEDRPPASILGSIGISLAILPIALLLLLVAFVKRNAVLSVWRNGEPDVATVVASKSSSLAPASQLLSVTLDKDASKRVVRMLHPRGAGLLSPGDNLAVVAPPGKPQRAIETALYA
jgi:hypothetical protein